ncbi:MAG: M20/M25/M40 family metallo-hydrolase [Marinovum sp.]|nr:M20/M25/M40 family metallo-hydrolase [Marinovum sp.]
MRFSPDPVDRTNAALPDVDTNAVAELLSQSIQFQTISHPLGAPNRPDDYQRFLDWVTTAFPNASQAMDRTLVSGFTPIYHWSGTDPDAGAILMSGHYDVVPIAGEWSRDPWAGDIVDGYVWGRGTMDMKSGVVTLLRAVDQLAAQGFKPKHDIYIALTQDEEIGGQGGAAAVAQYMLDQGIKIDWTLDEGSFVLRDIISSVDSDIAMINLAEKGYLTVRITAKADGGHSSMPQTDNAIARLAEVISALQVNQVPGGLDGLTADTFDTLAPHMTFVEKLLFANAWLFKPVLEHVLTGAHTTNALLRTTTAPTMLQGSETENVLPQAASVVINFRLHPRDTVDTVVDHIKVHLPDDDFEIDVLRLRPASPVADKDGDTFAHLSATVQRVFDNVVIVPGMTVGGTDSSHYAALTDHSYRFLPFVATTEDVGLLHAADERISIENLGRAVQYYQLLIEGL